MILTIDIGNTLTKIVLFDKNKIVDHIKIKSNTNRASDEYCFTLKSFLGKRKITSVLISSVVPLLTAEITEALRKVTNAKVNVLSRYVKTGINIKIDNPSELGTDFICESVAAVNKYGAPCIIADMGTSTKFCVVDKNKNIIGVSIAAGIGVSLEGLINNTAMLSNTDLIMPEKIIGTNTKASIQSGIVIGQLCMVESIVKKIDEELGYETKKILTGGYSTIIKDRIDGFCYDEFLTNEGLYKIYLMNI